jgi:2-polyprenyl-3-methyl-5-hydroxy-6-metoxy-1,4-benzoquinol methylase
VTVAEQRELWSAAPRDWAQLAEPANEPLFARVLDAVLTPGARLLDVACGSGYLARMAVERGAMVTGLDAHAGAAGGRARRS